MEFNTFGFIFEQVFISLKRNVLLTLASVITMIISLSLLGCSMLFLANASFVAETFESQVEIAVFLQDYLSSEQVVDLQNKLEKIEGVASVTLTTKENAIKEFEESMGSKTLLEDLGGINPFPDKFTIQTTDAHLVQDIASKVSKVTGVEKVRYGQGVLEKLLQFTDWLRWVGLAIVVIFTIASFILIAFNIKTNVYSREKEIQIMRLVGASNSFIRWPFIIEGMFIGLIGAVIAMVIVGFTYTWLLGYVMSNLTFLPVVADQLFISKVLGAMLLSGIGIGVLASSISVRQFLRT
ncbi:MAG: permease-like cell division protein FtsX [Eubacteriales bacterium]